MLENFKMNSVELKRQVKISIYLPDDYNRSEESYDVLYMLDGQNSFSDKDATFGRSLRAIETLELFNKEYDKKIIAVGIHSPSGEANRMNEYSPFKVLPAYEDENFSNDLAICEAFQDFFINTVIPFINKRYRCTKTSLIYGSSAGGIMSLYLAYRYPKSFSYVASFSNASFIMKNEYYDYLVKHENEDLKCYLYCGTDEDNEKFPYINTLNELASLLNGHCKALKTVIGEKENHCEASWGKYIYDFLKFAYNI